MTRADKILIFFLAVLAVCLIPITQGLANQRAAGGVTLASPFGNTVLDVPWDSGRTIEIQGSHGVVVFEATVDGIKAVESSCEDQLCVGSGVLSAANPIVCAPNGVAAFLVDSDGGFDAVSR